MKKYTNNSKLIVFTLLLTTVFTIGQIQGEILLQSGQYIFHGDESDSLLGYAVSGVGDVNNDGFDDYVMSAPGHDYNGFISNGAVYLFFGEEDKNMIDLNLIDADAVFFGEGDFDNAGTTLSKAGDVNGDGFDDFLIGAPFYSVDDIGKVYLIVGRSTAAWNKVNDLGSISISFYGDKNDDRLSGPTYENLNVLSDIGDIDDDGFDDIAFGSILHDINSSFSNHGKLYVYYGSDSISGNINVTTADLILYGANAYDLLGSVAGLGDINGDNIDDYSVGGYGYDVGEGNDVTGAVYIMYGSSDRLIGSHNVSDSGYGAIIYGEILNSYFGQGIFPIGDHNGDGLSDFAISAPNYESNTGCLYVFYGKEYSGLINATDADKRFYGEDGANDLFGVKAAGITDINGDGMNELAISEYAFDGSVNNQGRLYIYNGGEETGAFYPSNADMVIGWNSPTTKNLGYSLANAGDVNGDGMDDLITGAYASYNSTHSQLGAVMLLTKIFDNQKFTETEINIETITETGTKTLTVERTLTEENESFLPISYASIITGLLLGVAVFRANTRRKS
ncbi:MAG: hypothetical protein HeimC2_39640 [Candidatus Heimdallarchaeota archaeon LC_2]|nr:MAG: hypothetical protein HeimC2_39640 [Candidatus Heimdallarchaeota archaeon LC_2]